MRKRFKQNTIIVSSDEEGFSNVFLQEQVWYSSSDRGLEINSQRISQLKYIAIYVKGTKRILSIAEIKDIYEKKESIGNEISFHNVRKLDLKHSPVQGREYANLKDLISDNEFKQIKIEKEISQILNKSNKLNISNDFKINSFEKKAEFYKSIFQNKTIIEPIYQNWDKRYSHQAGIDVTAEFSKKIIEMKHVTKKTKNNVSYDSEQRTIELRVLVDPKNSRKPIFRKTELEIFYRNNPTKINISKFNDFSESGDLCLLINQNNKTIYLINTSKFDIEKISNDSEENFIKSLIGGN